MPLVLMLAGGERTLEDSRPLRGDEVLRSLLNLKQMPSSDATGDWLRRMGAKESGELAGLQQVNRGVFRNLFRNDERLRYMIEIDATQIVAEKREALYAYNGEKGYMPLLGHIAETGLASASSSAKAARLRRRETCSFYKPAKTPCPRARRFRLCGPTARRIRRRSSINARKPTKTLRSADQDAAVKAAIANTPQGEWKAFRDGEIAETVHCMNKTNKAFRLIVMRRPLERDLFEDKSPYSYHAIGSNRTNEDAAATME